MKWQHESELREVARKLVVRGKGILAADESLGTIEKRFKAINLPSTEENRRAYREMLFTTPGISDFISGIILFDETIHQQTKDGTEFAQLLLGQGILPGIKVDEGTEPLPGFSEDKVTLGLDGLRDRLAEYRTYGARFAKWRAVFSIGDRRPSDCAITANACQLALYAGLCQEAGLVPIVEPEVLMDGAHDIATCARVTQRVQHKVFGLLKEAEIVLEGMLLKPNMVLPGKGVPQKAHPEEVARETLSCLRAAVPEQVPGIVFLSGGQNEREATENLNAINQHAGSAPWRLSFSYGRALQNSALSAWAGKTENVDAAQKAFYRRAKLVALASMGEYSPDLERTPG